MILTRELAAQLAGKIFAHVETERTMLRHAIEEVLYDGLLLGLAKQTATPAPMIGGAASQELRDTAISLCKLLINDSALCMATPRAVSDHIDVVYRTLLREGWHP